jgi:trehalose/maltose hydrolase-like predicted phosphorylase
MTLTANPWILTYDRYEREKAGTREALTALGNGYFATRGAFPSDHDDNRWHYPGTYLAGGYSRRKSTIHGKTYEHETLINLPNWLLLLFKIDDGPWLNLDDVEMLAFRQALDLQKGVLSFYAHFLDPDGHETTIRSERLVHMRYPHLAAMWTSVTAENWSGRLTIQSALDGNVINNNIKKYRHLDYMKFQHLIPVATEFPDGDDGAGLDGRNLQRPRLLGRYVRLSLLQPAHAGTFPGVAPVSLPSAGGGVSACPAAGLRGRALSVAKRQHRQRNYAGGAP